MKISTPRSALAYPRLSLRPDVLRLAPTHPIMARASQSHFICAHLAPFIVCMAVIAMQVRCSTAEIAHLVCSSSARRDCDTGVTHKIEIYIAARLTLPNASVRPSIIPRTHFRIEFITISSHSSCSAIHHHPSSARNQCGALPKHLPSQVSCERGPGPL